MKDTFAQLVRKTRTVRCFQENLSLSELFLLDLIDMARLSGSARNGQMFKYMPITSPNLCGQLFPLLAWAGYLADWPGPGPGERPPAYIACLLDTTLLLGSESEACIDLGIASQSMLLKAATQGVFGCRIGLFNKESMTQVLRLPGHLRPLLVIALGYPAEEVVLEDMKDGDLRYWRDKHGVHHVPKRSLEEIVCKEPLV